MNHLMKKCEMCEGFGDKCNECDGIGFIATLDGNKLILFLEKFYGLITKEGELK